MAASAAVLLALALTFLPVSAFTPSARAATDALTVTMDRYLSLTDESAGITVSGDALVTLGPEASLDVMVSGPATTSQIAQPDPILPRVGGLSVLVGSLPGVARPSASTVRLPLPAVSLPASAGAFRVSIEVRSDGLLLAKGGTWMGRVAPRSSPLDLAFVWRAELGIHRDAQGRFYDTSLEQSCSAVGGDATQEGQGDGSLAALAGLNGRFPEWRYTLSIEPVLLTQLRDMAAGFVRADGSQGGAPVDADDPAAKNAKAVLVALAGAAEKKTVEVAAGSYASATAGLLAAQGWRDGFGQIQLGKQELVRTLGLGLSPSGAVAPGLDLSGGSVGDYGQASVDHVLVDASVASALNEKVPAGTTALRVHDEANDRVTLVFADSEVRALMVSPWDTSRLFAGIAAALASADRDAMVLTQGSEFVLPPSSYTDAIGAELEKYSWIRTQTMAGLLATHPPGTRPLLLVGEPAAPAGYVAQSVFAAIQDAHTYLDDLASGADPSSAVLEEARRSIYIAESRWWMRPGVSLEQANAGLAYALQAKTISQTEMSKIGFAGMKDAMVMGSGGRVTLVVRNASDTAVTVQLQVAGQGLVFPDGDMMQVKLTPGNNSLKVRVRTSAPSPRLTARLMLGRTVLGEQSGPLRFVTLRDVVPWAGLAVLVIVLLVMIVLLVRKGKRSRRRNRESPSPFNGV